MIFIKKILLLTMGFGSGHNSTAKAVEEHLQDFNYFDIKVIDLLELAPDKLYSTFTSGYNNVLNSYPGLYKSLYGWTQNSKFFLFLLKESIEQLSKLIAKKLDDIFQNFKPDLIVSFHPCALLLCGQFSIPSIGVATDYEIHPIWLSKAPDVLCIPPINVHKFPKELKLVITGIPIKKNFYSSFDKFSAREKLGLNSNLPIVLITGGGEGLGPLVDICDNLQCFNMIQFIVLTGHNADLKLKLESLGLGQNFCIEGHRDDIDVLMTAADLLVTKPGGIILTEAIAKKIPMLLFNAFQGQEKANQTYMVNNRVAYVTKPSSVNIQVGKFFTQKINFSNRFNKIHTPYALKLIDREIHKILKIKN